MGLKLIGEIALDGSGFERGLQKLGREAGASVKNLAVQAFGIYGVEQAIAKTVETAEDLVNTSKRLDVTVEQLQVLRQAAKEGGTEMGTLASAFEKLDIARAKALSGDKTAIAAFAKLGVSQAQLTTQTAATIFTGSLSNAAKSNNTENLAPAFKEILGKGFGELLPVLKTDFDELSGKMHRLGNIMDAETAVKLKAMSDQFGLLSTVVAVHLGPALIQLGVWILQAVGGLKQLAAFLGGISEQGPKKGAATLVSSMLDTPVGKFLQAATPAGALQKIISDLVSGKDKDDLLTKGGDAANEVDKSWKEMLDKLQSELDKAADELNHPKPIVPEVNATDAKSKTSRLAAVQTDALVRVGNFLGANGNTISRVDQQKLNLMKETNKHLDKISDKISGLASFGLNSSGIPMP